ncbi:MAG TPA: hypothetical protein VFS68_05800 [Candidatus Udaeobacter sp.]|nr:hypothetical protein [Candidatus Udaeobacter sp.]
MSLRIALAFAFLAPLSAGTVGAADLHPIIEIETGYFFGASENGKWITAEEAARSLENKTTYQVYSLTKQVGQITAAKPTSVEEPCPDTLMVSLSPKPKDGVIGLDAPWNALPRKPVIADTTQPVYVEAVREFLKASGITDPKVRITRILRVDLEGDGEHEVLINATNYFNPHDEAPIEAPKRGSYSIVMLRRVLAGKVQTQLVAGELYSKSDASNAPNIYKIYAVLDLNGDGKLEVIVHSFYYEGSETTIYRCEPDKIEAVLSAACGA